MIISLHLLRPDWRNLDIKKPLSARTGSGRYSQII